MQRVMPMLLHPNGCPIAYANSAGDAARPSALFIHGYRSDMQGAKALALHAHCQQQGIGFVRFDCRGHGGSGGDFLDCTLTDWLADVLLVIDSLAHERVILVGSSMGGHLMLLAALARPHKVAGLLGIAAAPDFTEKLMWARSDAARREALLRDGVVYLPSDYSDEPYAITMRLIEDGRKHLLLGAPIDINVPTILLHGGRDVDVPWQFSVQLAEALRSEDVDLILRKDADHRFSRDEDIALMCKSLDALLALSLSPRRMTGSG